MFTHDKNHQKALSVFEKIKSGSYVAIVSRHVLAEVLDVLRQKMLTDPAVRSAVDPTNTHRNMVQSLYKQFVTKVLESVNIRIKDTTDPTVAILEDRIRVLTQVCGEVTEQENCPICHSKYRYLEHDCPLRDDVLHAIIADRVGCDQVVTFDQDFDILRKIPKFAHLHIQVLS